MNPKKKVLIITYYWPPSGGSGVQRWVKFCKYLPGFNIEPIVLTVKNGTYPLLDETLIDQVPKDLKVFRSKIFEPYKLYAKILGKTTKDVATPSIAFSTDKSIFQKLGVWIRANFFIPDARRGWVYPSTKKAKEIISNHEISTIITTGPPNSTHLIGSKLKKWNPKIKWIMDMRDPWSKIFFNQIIPRTSIATSIDEYYEKQALKLADEVIVISKGMLKIQKEIYNRYYKVLTNGFDHSDFPEIDTTPNQKITIKYVGSMTDSAIPFIFFDALKSLTPEKRSLLSIDFYGSVTSKVFRIIEDYKLDDIIKFHGYIPHLEAKKEMQRSDFLLLVIPDTTDNELILTGKIFDYIAAKKPILCIGPIPGDASDIVLNNNLGSCFRYNERDLLLNFIEDILDGEIKNYKTLDIDFKNHPFSRYNLSSKLSNLIKTIN